MLPAAAHVEYASDPGRTRVVSNAASVSTDVRGQDGSGSLLGQRGAPRSVTWISPGITGDGDGDGGGGAEGGSRWFSV